MGTDVSRRIDWWGLCVAGGLIVYATGYLAVLLVCMAWDAMKYEVKR